MEAKQIKIQKQNNSSCVKRTSHTMNMRIIINPQVQLIASMQSVQRKGNNPITVCANYHVRQKLDPINIEQMQKQLM